MARGGLSKFLIPGRVSTLPVLEVEDRDRQSAKLWDAKTSPSWSEWKLGFMRLAPLSIKRLVKRRFHMPNVLHPKSCQSKDKQRCSSYSTSIPSQIVSWPECLVLTTFLLALTTQIFLAWPNDINLQ